LKRSQSVTAFLHEPAIDWWLEERLAWLDGYRCLVGIDEVGRGALAGPVVAAAVVLPYERVPQGVTDSKLLSPEQREGLYPQIRHLARGVGIGIVNAACIDEINILRATHEAMRLALADLPPGLFPDLALIDGLPVLPFPLAQTALVGGDGRSASIAAASIIAKVTRDRLMRDFDAVYPGYGFASNKGYGAPIHLRGLSENGPCAIHRLTFRPVAESLHRAKPAGSDIPPVSAEVKRTRRTRKTP